MADKKITRQLSIYINGAEVKNSLGAIGREIAKVKGQLREANDPDKIKKYKKELDKLGEKYGDVKDEIYGVNTSLQDLRGNFDKALNGALTGDIKQVKEGFKGLVGGLKSAIKSSLAFISTPLGAGIAAIAATLAAGKMWFDYNVELSKTLKLTKELTGLDGAELSSFRAKVKGLSRTFDKDFNSVLKSATTFSKQMKISLDDSLNLIELGFVKGADANGDFLEKLKEYPVQFENAGYSAKDFIKIATQEAKGGVFSDKLLDSIKEANISLREMGKSQKEALSNAFGNVFTDDLVKRIDSGSMSTKQALDSIIKKSEELGLGVKAQQAILSSVFKGAGEDVGGFGELVNQLEEAFAEQSEQLDENEEATLRLSKANQELEEATADLFDASTSGFSAMLTNVKAVTMEIVSGLLVGINRVFSSVEQLEKKASMKGVSRAAKDVAEHVAKYNEDAVKYSETLMVSSLKNINRLEKKIKNAGRWKSMTGAKNVYKEKLAEAKAYYAELKKIKAGASEEYKNTNTYKEKHRLEEDRLKAEKKSKEKLKRAKEEAQIKLNEKRQKAYKKQKDREAKNRDRREKALQKKKELYEKSEQELNALLNKKQKERELQQKTGIDRELTQIDDKYAKEILKYTLSEEEKKNLTLEQIARRENAIQQLENEKEKEKHELKKQRNLEFQEELKEIEDENRIADEEEKYDREAAATSSEEERQLILLEKAKSIGLLELEIEKNKELEKVKNVEGAEKMKDAIRKKYATKTDKINREFTTAEKALKSDTVKWTKFTEEEKLSIVKNALNSASTVFNEGSDAWKATKIAETTIATYQSATNAYSSLAGIPVVGPALGIVASGLAVASGIRNVQKIASTPLKKMPKHYYGGHTGQKAVYNDEFGAVTGVVHDNEWVAPKFMTQSPKYAPTIQWLESERQSNLKGYYEGGNTSTTEVTSDPGSTPTEGVVSALLYKEIKRLNNHLDEGIIATSLIGDDNIATLKIREQKLINARERAKIK